MLCHLKSRMAKKFLEGESVSLAINKEFTSEGVTKGVKAGLSYSPPMIVLENGFSQSVLSQHFTEFTTEQIFRRGALANDHVITKDIDHQRTEGQDLNFSCFGVTERNTLF